MKKLRISRRPFFVFDQLFRKMFTGYVTRNHFGNLSEEYWIWRNEREIVVWLWPILWSATNKSRLTYSFLLGTRRLTHRALVSRLRARDSIIGPTFPPPTMKLMKGRVLGRVRRTYPIFLPFFYALCLMSDDNWGSCNCSIIKRLFSI